jgi:PAS domain S-box-containing protein
MMDEFGNSPNARPIGAGEHAVSALAATNSDFAPYRAELDLGHELYRQLIQDLPAAVYLCDACGRVRLFNEAAADLWGRRPEIGVDMWCGSLRIYNLDGSPMPLEQCPMAVALHEGRPVRDVEIIVERPDGVRRRVLPFPSPIFADGKLVGAINMLVDVTERNQADVAQKAADIAQAKLAAIIESSDDAIVSKTLDGIITSWNGSAERLFGYTEAEAIGKSIYLIVPSDRADEEAQIISRLRKGERIEHFDTQRLHKDGRLLDISVTISPVRDSSGKIIGASKIAREISDRKRLEEDRERLLDAERYAREQAQHVNRMKDEFLATLSHELRTPLNAVMGWARLLTSGHMSPADMRDAGQVIERNARLQKQLIDDLLDMSRIISGKLRLEVQRVDPITVIKDAIDTIQSSADAKGIRIERILDSLTGPVSGDPARLQQIVWNLLSNAIKFTPRGGRVQVVLQRADSQIQLVVSDTGQGINPEFLPDLFSRFSQADASTNRRHGGLGLGLAIVKQLVELQGGCIDAKSDGPGKGASFIVHLPVLVLKETTDRDEISPGAAAEMYSAGSRTDLSALTVLVVDDERDARELIKRLLNESGAQVLTSESAADALDMLANQDQIPDMLISDIGMPGIDGYDFLRKVRKINGGACARIPAIALTAFARSEDRTRALRAGYIAHVAKPVEPSELLATIAVVAGRVEEHA